MQNLEHIETFLREKILPELEKGRPNVDKPHTECVVKKLKELLDHAPKNLNLDRTVLLITAYTHDWGYTGLFDKGRPAQYDEIQNMKKLHMKVGAEKTEKLLRNPVFDKLTKEQKERIIYLVRTHDSFNRVIEDADERVFIEADTLGVLDLNPKYLTFNKESNDKYIKETYRKRFPVFLTEWGKKEFKRLMGERIELYEKKD